MPQSPSQVNAEPADGSAGKAPAAKRVSMRDVAKAADVSIGTVSMVLNGSERISRATHIKVQRVIDRLGYRPNRLAQSLSSQYTRTLAILLPPLRHAFSDPYFGELISGICDRATRFGHKVMIEQSKPDFIREDKHIELFERRYVDGILCLGVNDRHGFIKDFLDRDYPVMVVNNSFEQWRADHVVCDYAGGADQAMNYLLQLGHRKIGLIHAAPEAWTSRQVTEVYRRRLESVGGDVSDDLRIDGHFTEEGGCAAVKRLIAARPDVTAVFATNDKMALGALHCLTEAGRRVPDDVSVMGFDDITHTAFVNPALTTVHLPLYEVGDRACARLIERVRGKTEHVSETLNTHLVIRESTGLARSIQMTTP